MVSTYPEPSSAAAAPAREPDSPAAAPSAPTADLEHATGTLMALLPSNAETAQRVLAQATRSAGVSVEQAVQAAAALRGNEPPASAAAEAALRAAIDRVLATDRPAKRALPPDPHTLRHHLARFSDLRRRTFTTPRDATLRARYEDAGYTLCVLLGHPMVHRALNAAGQLAATQRLDGPAHSARPNN
ncbi:DUF5133 domain-containing protein [Streptomyces sp. ISL-43]|uniref:DUF5133 domain-containing protein n=1 Tax=Streptomyces sp. ISL-43 TaxID=2819183 RepID=UPI001BEA4E69|nr:DUF5133 domain-containing protein [Streptomyces sp. ISL-43]MBT2449782.1 DUF5133 domain-containing protein [Streptomyces sp. ISL-43]